MPAPIAVLPDTFQADPFRARAMTARINTLPYFDPRMRTLLPWNVVNSPVRDLAIQRGSQGIAVLPTSAPGAPGTQVTTRKRNLVKLDIPRYAAETSINAGEVVGRIDPASGNFDTLEAIVATKQATLLPYFSATSEYVLQGALNGKILDADGSTLYDFGTILGESPVEDEIDWETATTDIPELISQSKEASEKQLAGFPQIQGWALLMLGTAAPKLRSHPVVKKAKELLDYEFAGSDKRKRVPVIANDVQMISYTGYRLPSGETALDDNIAYLVPLVDGLFEIVYAPMETFDSELNGPGLELYSYIEPQSSTTVRVVAESNIVAYSKRPSAIRKIVLPH